MGRVLDIKAKSSTDLEIQVKVRNQEAAKHLGRKILTMPELQPYHVDLAVSWQ